MTQKKEHIESPAVGCLVGRAYQCMLSQLADALHEAGLDITNNEYLVLRAIYSNDGLQQCEIARLTGKDKALVCRTVASLEKKGLVICEEVSHKCLKVHVTPAAQEIEPRIMEVAALRHAALVDLCTPQEFDAFVKILNKIVNTK